MDHNESLIVQMRVRLSANGYTIYRWRKKSDSRRQVVYELQERGSEVLEECRRQSVYTAKQKELIHKRQKRWAITLAVPIPYLDVGTAYFVRSRYTF